MSNYLHSMADDIAGDVMKFKDCRVGNYKKIYDQVSDREGHNVISVKELSDIGVIRRDD